MLGYPPSSQGRVHHRKLQKGKGRGRPREAQEGQSQCVKGSAADLSSTATKTVPFHLEWEEVAWLSRRRSDDQSKGIRAPKSSMSIQRKDFNHCAHAPSLVLGGCWNTHGALFCSQKTDHHCPAPCLLP